MENIALNLTGLLTSALGVCAFLFLFFAQHHSQPPAQRALRWIAAGVTLSIYSVTRVWLIYAQTDVFAGGTVPVQRSYGVLMAAGLMFCIIIPNILRLRQTPAAHTVRSFAIGIAASGVAFGMYAVNFFQPIAFPFVIVMNVFAVVGFLLPGYAALRLRARYPGATFEALVVAGGLFAVIMTILMMVFTSNRAESAVVKNQSAVIAHMVELQATNHLTKDALDPKLPKGTAELKEFIANVSVPELLRVKVVRADGLVLASDLEQLQGTRVLLEGPLRDALAGEVSSEIVQAADLPTTEQRFGDVRVVSVPLNVTAGQPAQGVAQLFFDAPSTFATIQSLQNSVNFAGITMILTIIIVVTLVLQVFRRSVSKPFAEVLHEIEHMHMETDSGEHRRLKVRSHSDFASIAGSFNHLINEYEQRIRDLKQLLEKQKWNE